MSPAHESIQQSTALLSAAFLMALYVVVEGINLFFLGSSLTRWIIRAIRHKIDGTQEIEIPEELVGNPLIIPGSEIIVGSRPEWDGENIRRFAIPPSQSDAEPGTVMQVIRVTRSRLILKPITPPCAPPRRSG